MEHVSTLCALSTIGIAATGYALARPERRVFSTPSSIGRRNTWSRNHKPSLPFTGHFFARSPSHECEAAPCEPFTTSITVDNPTNLDQQGPVAVGRTFFRRSSSRVRRQTYTSTPTRVSGDLPSRPSSSWRQRLSLVSASATSSNSTRPASSKSKHGSLSSVLSREPEIEVRTHNKLVKRSASQHSFSTPPSTRPLRSAGLRSLRRPATSYQRAAEKNFASATNRNMDPNIPFPTEIVDADPVGEPLLRPFFSSHNADPLDRRLQRLDLSPRQRDQLLPLLTSDGLGSPILTLSTSLSTRDRTHHKHHHHHHGWQKKPPSGVAANATSTNSKRIELQEIEHISVEKRTPRHSASTGHIAPGTLVKQPSASPRRRSPRPSVNGLISCPPMLRNVSNPLPREAGTTSIERDTPPRLRRKRNFTDSNLLRRRPSTAVDGSGLNPSTLAAKPPGSRRPSLPSSSSSQPIKPAPLARSPQQTENKMFPAPSSHSPMPPSSSPPFPRNSRVKRFSNPTSDDRTSTLIGSDDTRIFTSGDEDDQSDSAFDSFRTRITASSQSGRRGPRIETIFQDAPNSDSLKVAPLIFEDLPEHDLFLPHVSPRSSHSSLGDDLDSPGTGIPLSHLSIHSQLQKAIPISFTLDEDTKYFLPSDIHHQGADKTHHSPHQMSQTEQTVSRHTPSMFPSSLPVEDRPITRNRPNLFHWSEPPKVEHNVNDPAKRPKTVDGKQGANARDSRGHSRKAPITLHLRSQSVPVSRDGTSANDGRESISKFGTWGLGHKGVSEHWDGDFDFGDSDESSAGENETQMTQKDGRMMKVPQAIMERQANVHGQFGHVQELTMLVEELKRLRLQGNRLAIIDGPAKDLWKEAEGIISLATIDDEENSLSPQGTPTSRLSFDDRESNTSSRFSRTQKRSETDNRRTPLTAWPNPSPNNKAPPISQQDPSSKVKSVLDTIYQQRELRESDIAETSPSARRQKLPFDTQSLRDLVARASVVTRSLKEVIRKADDVTTPTYSAPPHILYIQSHILNNDTKA